MDMLSHTSKENLLCGVIFVHPFTNLRMPHQAVTTQLNTILTAEVSNTVSSFPCKFTFIRFGQLRLHVVLSSNTIKFTLNERLLFSICNVTLIESNTNPEIIFVGIFQPLSPHRCRTTHHECYNESLFKTLFHVSEKLFMLIVFSLAKLQKRM